MSLIFRLIIVVAANAIGIWASATYLPGFHLSGSIIDIATLGLILTGLNLILKPILKLLLGPLIVLTLGLGIFLINALILYILDILSPHLTIDDVYSLGVATIIVGAANLIAGLFI